MTPPLRVAVDARLQSGEVGGTEQFVIGLAGALSRLTDGDEEYMFLVHPGHHGWLEPYLGGPCRMLPAVDAPPRWKSVRVLHRVRGALMSIAGDRVARIPESDGTIERAGTDVVHFALQPAFLTVVPSIYHPWDLQHRHFPEFFPRDVVRLRDLRYRAFCERARMVAVASEWGRRDLIAQYGVPSEKIEVIPVAPPTAEYASPSQEQCEDVRRRHGLPEAFAFYPAQTWPHKNHLALFAALRILRDRGERVPLVCSGRQNDFFPTIERRAKDLGLADDVAFLGFVAPVELQALYRLCRCVVFPTKFEGGGFPLLEAFHAGAPIACSNATLLPEQAGDAAVLFDADKPDAIAAAIERLWTDEELRRTLVERGRERVRGFSWDRTARLFRAHYRRVAGAPLTEDDRALLAASAREGGATARASQP